MLTKNSQSIRLGSLELESGAVLSEVEIAYHTYGALNREGSNVVLVLHALTGSSAAHEWWSELIGEGRLLDPKKYFIIAPNLLGSCYGTSGPESTDSTIGKPYLATFPTITPRDMARANLTLLDRLGIAQVHFAIGGSLGGMVVLEMAALTPKRFRAIVPIAVSGSHSAWRVAFSSFIRKAIVASDPTLQDRAKLTEGMKLARQAAMISYRSNVEFDERFGRSKSATGSFEVESYLEHQGEKLATRFSPYSYLTLTRAMELYDLSERRGAMRDVEASFAAKSLFVGISSDILYGADEIKRFALLFPNGLYRTLHALHGHDSFLVDTDALAKIIAPFLEELVAPKHTFALEFQAEEVAA